jgi:hypothetical protein
MAQASDYPVSFGYGATTAPYSPAHPHTGEDRAMPQNIEINVGNTVIGYVGKTGKATGYHVHVQKYKGGFLHPHGAGLGNTIAFPARVSEVGYNIEIGNFVRLIDASGFRWSYFHMTKQNVAVGHIINAYQVPAPAPQPAVKGDTKMNDAEEQDAYQIVLERPREGAASGRRGIDFIRDAKGELAQRRASLNNQIATLSKQAQDAQTEASNNRLALQEAATLLQLKNVEADQKSKLIGELQQQLDEAKKQAPLVVKGSVDPATNDAADATAKPAKLSIPKLDILLRLFVVFLKRKKL